MIVVAACYCWCADISAFHTVVHAPSVTDVYWVCLSSLCLTGKFGMKSFCLMQDFQAVGAQACKDTLQELFRDKNILKVTLDEAMVSCHHVCLLYH